jgi:hypothetical protein
VPGSTSVVTSMPYKNCNHVKDIKFAVNIPCIATLDDDLVVFWVLVLREAAISSMQ